MNKKQTQHDGLTLSLTTHGRPLAAGGGRKLYPVNTCRGGVSCTLNTRYDDLSETTDVLTLAHFPKTVILISYD